MKTLLTKQGFSLVEILVALLAAVILFLIVGLLLLMPYRTMQANEEYAQLRRDVAVAMRAMTRDIRAYSATDIDISQSDRLLLNSNPGPPVRQKIEYIYNSGNQSLSRSINDVDQGEIIEEGLIVFTSSVNALGGVVLNIGMESSRGNASLSHQTVIHTRN